MICYDIHSHLLPQMDDGSKSLEESIKLINILHSKGITKIALTPHFYSNEEPMEKFIERRNTSLECLREHIPQGIEYTVGAEVFYSDYLFSINDISPLCYQGTDYLLLEMGYTVDISTAVSRVERLVSQFNVTPIIAHVERYKNLSKPSNLEDLVSCGCEVQINWNSMDAFFTRRHIGKLIGHKMVQYFGTDTHSEDRGPTDIAQHNEWLKKQFGAGFFSYISENSQKLFVKQAEESKV